MKIRGPILVALLLLCLNVIFASINIVSAAQETYPIPNDAILKFEKSILVGPTSGFLRSYSTMLNKEQILGFFRKELLKAGWTETLKRGLAFTKDDKIISVLVLDGKPRPTDKKTYFSVVVSTKITDEMMQASAKDKPDKLNFMPTYPNAKQAVLWDNANGVMGSYTTEDPINVVVDFYKNKMPAYGWILFMENPIAKKEECKDCLKKLKSTQGSKIDASQIKGNFYTADLKYKRPDDQFCTMNFTSSDYSGISVSKQQELAGFLPSKKAITRMTMSYRDMKNVQ